MLMKADPIQPALTTVRRTPPLLVAAMALIALTALFVPTLLVIKAPRVVAEGNSRAVMSKRVVPRAELPPVEPVQLQAVDPDDARAINAAIPFSKRPNPAARAFRIFGLEDSRARAVDCLAAGVYYEAGDDAVGERAVAQVIINRVRHPAFPKSVCAVVFQGSERSTGCQFTFTCDGAMLRYRPTEAAWQRARDVARMALGGSVYQPVGHATHYHTDWVVPYWSASLEKITEVHTHLFFRWAGWWGTPPAFNRDYTGVEPNIALMARLSPAHHGDGDTALDGLTFPTSEGVPVDPATIPDKAVPPAIGAEGVDANNFLVVLDRKMSPDAFAALAIKTCGERSFCKFMAWSDARNKPTTLPLSQSQVATMSFSYLRDQNQGFAKALWNCQQFKRPSPIQCMREQPPAASAAAPAIAPVALPTPTSGPQALGGVRRKADAPAAVPAKPQSTFSLPAARSTPSPAPNASVQPR